MNTGLSREWADLANVGLSMLSWVSFFFKLILLENANNKRCRIQVSNIASAFMIDRFGRRPLLVTTLTIILVVNILISALMIGYEQTQAN